MRKKKKASDIYHKTEYVFKDKLSFSEEFTSIEEISIEILTGLGDQRKIRKYSKSNYPGEYYDCPNPLCYGGFSLGDIIREMVSNGTTHIDDTRRCIGHEGVSTRVDRECIEGFRVIFEIKYAISK